MAPEIFAALVIVDVALIRPPVNKLAPEILAALVTVLVALINPPVSRLAPVTLPTSDAVVPVKLPENVTALNVPLAKLAENAVLLSSLYVPVMPA